MENVADLVKIFERDTSSLRNQMFGRSYVYEFKGDVDVAADAKMSFNVSVQANAPMYVVVTLSGGTDGVNKTIKFQANPEYLENKTFWEFVKHRVEGKLP